MTSKDGKEITDGSKKAEMMNNFFVGVGQELAQKFTENTTGNKNNYVYRVTPTVTSVNIKTDKLSGQLKKKSKESIRPWQWNY